MPTSGDAEGLRHHACDKLLAVDLPAGGDVEVLEESIHFVIRELLSETRQNVSEFTSTDLPTAVLVEYLRCVALHVGLASALCGVLCVPYVRVCVRVHARVCLFMCAWKDVSRRVCVCGCVRGACVGVCVCKGVCVRACT